MTKRELEKMKCEELSGAWGGVARVRSSLETEEPSSIQTDKLSSSSDLSMSVCMFFFLEILGTSYWNVGGWEGVQALFLDSGLD